MRHRYVTGLLALHLVGIPLYAYIRSEPVVHALHSLVPVVIMLAFACSPTLGRTMRSTSAAFGLMYCSGVIVHLSHGLVEAHFHFFVIIPVVALYEAWLPFVVGVLYVLVHHGWMGTVDPHQVYNHPGAWAHPWLFAAVHATFFACACLACIVNWWLHERAREEAQAQSHLLSTIVESMRDGLVVTDAAGGVLLRNPSSTTLLEGVDWRLPAPGEITRGQVLLRPDDGTPVSDEEMPHAQALVHGRVDDLDLVHRGSDDGADRVLSFSATALHPRGDDDRLVVVMARDITARHQTQAALAEALATEQRAVERLHELERVKSDLVSTVSHELRTPITSIMGYLEVLQDGDLGELNPAQHELVGRVDRNSRRLLLLVEDLLTHSQIESEHLSITQSPTDLREVVGGALEAVGVLLEQRRLEVVVDLPHGPLVQPADAHELERMVVNLLTNAIKFTPDGGRIDVLLNQDERGATLVIADDGLGIPEEEQHLLFTRFFRSAIASELAIQGTGLGLSIVRAIVLLHGGRISVDSTPGHGTAFTVELPYAAPHTWTPLPTAV